MDDVDIATRENERHFERSMLSFTLAKNQEKERLQSMQNHGIVNKCLYCSEVLEGYESAFCDPEEDWSCRAEHEKEQYAVSSGRVVKVYD